MLESAKDRILGVDIPEQHVPLRVRYGVGNWRSYSPRLTRCKRSRGATAGVVTHPGIPWETLALLWYCDYLS
jgi:hypothetical protein